VRIVVDTGVFSAALSPRRRSRFEPQVRMVAGNHVFLAAVTVSELHPSIGVFSRIDNG